MKKAFTLVELLIVIAVLAILMGMAFGLGNVGSDSYRRTQTISRMQKLENCLSGYYAAFGSYPPVKLHGSRDIYTAVGSHGVQRADGTRNENIWNWNKVGERNEWSAWNQVRAACRAQPLAARFPFPDKYGKIIDDISEGLKRQLESDSVTAEKYKDNEALVKRITAKFDDGGGDSSFNRFAAHADETDWRDVQVFQFGLMSFLLPRYLVMMNGDENLFEKLAQWTDNNQMPSDPFTGRSYSGAGGWKAIRRNVQSAKRTDYAKVANIPNQAVCARWIPNLKDVCRANHKFDLFGIDIRDDSLGGELHSENFDIQVYSPDGPDSNSRQYVLDSVSVCDGWWNDFYYYSPAPYQRYTLWSSGANSRTFPPWVNRSGLSSKANECVGMWAQDDIIHLSN